MQIFKSLEDVYDCYGKSNIVPITNIKQIIFYTSKYRIQPKWITQSDRNEGHLVCYFHKGETKDAYEVWMKNR